MRPIFVGEFRHQASAKYLYLPYILHRTDGAEGLKERITGMRAKIPDSHCEIKHVFVVDSYVILHVHAVREPGARGSKHEDLIVVFRIAHPGNTGKIFRHGDPITP